MFFVPRANRRIAFGDCVSQLVSIFISITSDMVYLKILLAIAIFFTGIVDSARLKRQTGISQENGAVIDSVFNIPITAIKQTAAAVQAFSPENSETIDNVFKIPITTLQAVQKLVKNRNPQKRHDIQEEKLKRQKYKKEKLLEKQEQLKLQKLQKEELRKKKVHFQKERYYKKRPLRLNPLNNPLITHHEISGSYGLGNFGSHGVHLSYLGHVSRPVHDSHAHQGHTYEVHEIIDEPPYVWPGWPGSTFTKIEKIAPRDEERKQVPPEDAPLENKIAPKNEEKMEKPEPRISRRSSFRFESDPPPKNFWPID